MKINLENFKSYTVNSVVILFSVILSFYRRKEMRKVSYLTNQYINDIFQKLSEFKN